MGTAYSRVYIMMKFFTSSDLSIQWRFWRGRKEPKQEKISISKAGLQDLPAELILRIFSFLELKPYVIAHGVCKTWKELLPLADIHPIRRRMLKLCYSISKEPYFTNSREMLLNSLQPFDRQAYIDALLSQYPAIPEEFRLWILEWPEGLPRPRGWPAVPFQATPNLLLYGSDVNWLGYRPDSPQLLTVEYEDVKLMPALLVWRSTDYIQWLIFDQDEPDIFGYVFTLSISAEDTMVIIPSLNNSSDNASEDSEWAPIIQFYSDWISYQEREWSLDVDRAIPYLEGVPIQRPIAFRMASTTATVLPAPLWEGKDSPYVKALFA